MRNTPDNSDDIIDSRDVIARIEELESEVADIEEAEDFDSIKAKQDHAELYDELATLQALAEEGEDYASDWRHGETLIRDSYFESYAQELANDVCEMPRDVKWPYTCIDWEAATDELKQDYTTVDFGGVDYWIRSC